MLINIAELHFIRPWWLLAFLPLAAYLIWYWFFQGHKSDWQRYLDPALAKYMLTHEIKGKANKWLYALCVLIAASLVVFALAGPTWEKISQPVFNNRAAIVVVLDLSRSMDSVDLKPSRLTRAKQKLNDLLQLNKGGQTALIVYAANAYVVTPLTDDIKTIATHIPNLSTDIIQAQGSRPDKALLKAQMLLKQANINRGQVVLLSDSFELNKVNKAAIALLVKDNHRLSIIGVGTAAGAPIVKHKLKTNNQQQTGGFVTDAQGNIVIPKLDVNTLRKAAQLGGGRYIALTVGEEDLKQLNIRPVANNQQVSDSAEKIKNQRSSDEWYDMGAYLLLLVIPLFLFGFRRGVLFSFYTTMFMMLPAETSYALDLPAVFLNKNQQAKRAFEQQQYNVASEKFTQPEWLASAAYKQGQFEQTITSLAENNSSDALYNKGNAYAKMGELERAVEQYEASLRSKSDNPDAEYNLDLVKKALEQQKQQQQDQRKDDQQQGNQQQNSESQDQQEQGEQSQNEQDQKQNAQSQQQPVNNPEQADEKNSEQQNQGKTEDSDNNGANNQSAQQNETNQEDEKSKENTEQLVNQQQAEKGEKETQAQEAQQSSEMAEEDNNQQQLQQWLRRIEDDPSGLLRRKFQYQDYMNKQQAEKQQW